MNIYLASISTNLYEIDKKAYKNIDNTLKYIYNNLKKLTTEYIEGCNFFDRDYVKKCFTEEFFKQNTRVICRSEFGEFIVEKVKNSKYQYIFAPIHTYDTFIVCELEMLELLD